MGVKHAYKSGITTKTAYFTIPGNHVVILVSLCPLRLTYIRTNTFFVGQIYVYNVARKMKTCTE